MLLGTEYTVAFNKSTEREIASEFALAFIVERLSPRMRHAEGASAHFASKKNNIYVTSRLQLVLTERKPSWKKKSEAALWK